MVPWPGGATRAGGARGRSWLPGALLVASLCALLLTLNPSAAQQAGAEVKEDFCRWREFQIPFDASDTRISRILLYISEDRGRTWVYRAAAQPSLGHKYFEFRAEHDGWYYFAVQTEAGGQKYPAQIDAQTQASRKVCVDTRRPVVTLRAAAAPAGQAAVSWEVQDDNLNNLLQNKPDTLQLEYRAAGRDATWTRVAAEQKAVGQASWPVTSNAPLEVHLRVADDAGNVGEMTANVTPGAGGGAAVSSVSPEATPAHGPAPAARQFTNQKKVQLKYGLEDVGRSGVSVVEVWTTTDGRSWQMLKPWRETLKGSDKPSPIPLTFENEGLYGFTLVPRSGVGRGVPGPQQGDEPQIWIEVDWTKPVVHLSTVDVGRGADDGFLLVSWTAKDNNLTERPISLSWASDPKGTWAPLAEGLPNDGFYRWKIDEDKVPVQFYVKVQARDRAGNVGEAVTAELIKVDLKQPRANVSGIEPVTGNP